MIDVPEQREPVEVPDFAGPPYATREEAEAAKQAWRAEHHGAIPVAGGRLVTIESASYGPDVSGMGQILSVKTVDVEQELALDAEPPTREEGRCGARHEIGMGDLICNEKTPDHLRPHRDTVHGVAWDASPLGLPWPPHTAALIVRDLLDAHQAVIDAPPAGSAGANADWLAATERWDAAAAAAEMLPGVTRETEEIESPT